MLTFQARESAESLLDVLTGKNDAILGVQKICDVNLSVEKHLTSLLIDKNKAGSLVSGINNQLNNERKKIDEVEVSKLFISIHSLIEELKSNDFHNRSLLDEPIKELQSFNNAFENYVRSYRPPEIADLVFSARAAKRSIDNLIGALDFFLTNTSENSFPPENNSEITIALSSEFKLEVFILKLNAIQGIYSELCMVLNISKSEFPLEVIKVESGSLFAKLFGNANVIKLLGKFIESGASYVYRNFTNEGKLQSIPRKVETIESIIKLRETLISSGIEVDQKMEDHIKKSSVAISKELNNLISGEGEIIVNDTKISIGEEVQKKLSDERGLLKLEHSEG